MIISSISDNHREDVNVGDSYRESSHFKGKCSELDEKMFKLHLGVLFLSVMPTLHRQISTTYHKLGASAL